MKQDKFFNNNSNKSQFVNIFQERLEATNIFVKQGNDDANVAIVCHTTYITIIVGENVFSFGSPNCKSIS